MLLSRALARFVAVSALAIALVAATLAPASATAWSHALATRQGATPTADTTAPPPTPDADTYITGLVNAPDGSLLDDISVEAIPAANPDADPVASAITYQDGDHAHGAYKLNVPAGDYKVRFSSLDFARPAYETAYHGGADGTTVTVAKGTTVDLDAQVMTVDTGAPVTGSVVDEAGKPIAGVDVSLYRYYKQWNEWDPVDWSVTDANGGYRFDKVNRGPKYSVKIYGQETDNGDPLGFSDSWLGGAVVPSSARSFTLPAGSPGTNLGSTSLVNGVTVTGKVLEPNGAPVRYVSVELLAYDSGDKTFESVDWAYDESGDGAYRFAGVMPGQTYTVLAYSGLDEFASTYLGDVESESKATTFTTTVASDPLQLDAIRLAVPAVNATGAVTEPDGTPLDGAKITLWRWIDEPDWVGWDQVGTSTTTADDGSYSFRKLSANDTYTVQADGTNVGFGVSYLGGVDSQANADRFTLPADGSVRQLAPIHLTRAAKTVRGHVLLSDGARIDGHINAELLQWNPDTQQFEPVSEYAGSTSRFVFKDVTPGDGYTVHATYDANGTAHDLYGDGWLGGAYPQSDQADGVFSVVAGQDDTAAGDITLQRGRLLSGSITAGGGAAAYGTAQVDLYRWNSSTTRFDFYRESWTDDGSYGFVDVPEGVYAVWVTYRGYSPDDHYVGGWLGGAKPTSPASAGAFSVAASGDTTGIDYQLQQGVVVSGTVRASDGTPLSDASLNFYQWGDDNGSPSLTSLGYASTDERGRYSFVSPTSAGLWFRATRHGMSDYYLGGSDYPAQPTAANTLNVGQQDLTEDVVMDADWHNVPSDRAAQRLPYCLAHPSDRWEQVPFGPADGLYVSGTGVISDRQIGAYRPELLASDGRVSVLAPFMDRGNADYADSKTWGISPDGSTLCVLWQNVRSTSSDAPGNSYQVLVKKSAGGGYDVTYDYDQVAWSTEPKAGYSDGSGHVEVFSGYQDGYLDTATTGLTKNELGSDQVGRYSFHFDGFDAPYAKPKRVASPTVDGTVADTALPGQQLTATPGAWTVDGVKRTDLEYAYVWKGNASGRVEVVGTGSTYTPKPSDAGGDLWVTVQASQGGPTAGFADSQRIAVSASSVGANTSAPTISALPASVGDRLVASPGDWTVTDGTVDDVYFSYRWLRNGQPIRGAVYKHYVVRQADELQQLSVEVTAFRDGYASVQATSEPSTIAANPKLAYTTAPSISGDPGVGKTLTVDPGTWDTGGTGDPTFTYKWVVDYRTVNPDPGTGGTKYTVHTPDAGYYVTVYVYASKPGFKGTRAFAVTPVISKADVGFGSLTGTVTRTADGAVVPNASWQACEQQTWNCVDGVTDSAGKLSAPSLAATGDGIQYHVTVFGPEGSKLMNGDATTSVVTGQTSDVAIGLESYPSPPGNVDVPTSNGTKDGIPVVYWQEAQKIVVDGCAVANPSYSVKFSDGHRDVTGSMTALPDQGGVAAGLTRYGATIPAFYPAHDDAVVSTNIPANCSPGTQTTAFTVYIDPSGVVTDQYGVPVANATVTLLRSDAPGGPFTKVEDGSDVMSATNRKNPDTTGADGSFRWDVSAGYYKVQATADGCTQGTTAPLPVPPAAIDLLIKLTCKDPVPTIAGAPKVGSTLTTPSLWDRSLGDAVQWLRNGQKIPGATDTSYTLTQADTGSTITVQHTGQRAAYVQQEGRGEPVVFDAAKVTSAAVTVANGPAPTAPAPAVGGIAKVGNALTVGSVAWSAPVDSSSYQWLRDGVAIPGATGSSWTLQPADAGKHLSVRVTGRRAGYDDGSVTSAAVPVGNGSAPTVTVAPHISGTPAVGSTLTASAGSWSPAVDAASYQWLRNGVAIPGATAATWTVTAADATKALSVVVTAVKSGYDNGTATSAAVTVGKMTSRTLMTVPRKAKHTVAVTMTVRVSVLGLSSPTGKVKVLNGAKALKTVTLKAGRAVVQLGKLRKGKYKLSAKYLGTALVSGSAAKAVLLTVT